MARVNPRPFEGEVTGVMVVDGYIVECSIMGS